MELFLRIFRVMLLTYVFILGLAISFVGGGLVTIFFDIPEQPDYRDVLDKITQDMHIQQVQHLLEECFNCSTEMNSKNRDFSNEIWVAPGHDRKSWHYCLVADSQGAFWDHKYIFFFGADDKLMGIAEHPFDGSWGYQVTGYYAPTSRYGTPEDFQYLINVLHKNGIGVILDWVPAHFPRDAHGLAEFDGTCLYEHPDPRLGEHPDWGTKIFNYGKNEVRNFLIANALFWVKEYHIDGLRVDAVASMLYLDYGKQAGGWVPNKYGGNENLEAIEFFKHLNSVIRGGFPGVCTIAEESTAWPKVTAAPEDDGLGFTFKWNMGWMHDFCEYMKLDPYFRKNNHNKLTFAMSYNSSENYILPLSHDEVVHLKCSMVNKMPGYQIDKYANLRVGYTYMFTHEGKKLLFMGQEFGQEREWSEERELDWFLLENHLNRGMLDYVAELLKIYRKYPSLYEFDASWDGFEWVNADDADRSIYSYIRKGSSGKNDILVVLNMTPMRRNNYWVGVPNKGKYKLLLNSDEKRFGGNGGDIPSVINATEGECDNRKYHLEFDLPSYGAAIFVF